MTGYISCLNTLSVSIMTWLLILLSILVEIMRILFYSFLSHGSITHRFINFNSLDFHGIFISQLFEHLHLKFGPHRFVDFNDFNFHGIFISQLFGHVHLKFFCILKEDVFRDIMDLFCSNLHFTSRNSFVFSFAEQNILVNAEALSKIFKAPFHDFVKIPVSPDKTYSFCCKNIHMEF